MDDHDNEDLLPDIWVERKTGFLYECKFFDTFVIVRPATPAFYLAIRRVRHNEFMNEFEEFSGDKDIVREFINSAPPDFIIETD